MVHTHNAHMLMHFWIPSNILFSTCLWLRWPWIKIKICDRCCEVRCQFTFINAWRNQYLHFGWLILLYETPIGFALSWSSRMVHRRMLYPAHEDMDKLYSILCKKSYLLTMVCHQYLRIKFSSQYRIWISSVQFSAQNQIFVLRKRV